MLDSNFSPKLSMRRLFYILIAFAFLVSACGQKGPLYLPKDADKSKKTEPRKTEEGTIER
jgi:predicted small lipoprotein YifL